MIYFVRHGQTDWNIVHKCQGHKDIDLNDVGIKQAETLKEKLKNVSFNKVFSSPLKRAIHTAKIITSNEIIVDNRLIERDNGLLEGEIVNWQELQKMPNFEEKYKVETINSLKERTESFFEDICKKYPKQNILVVSHAGVFINAYNYFFKTRDLAHIDNADVFIFKN